MNPKRRKIEKDSKLEEFDPSKFLSELSGYAEFLEKKGSDYDITISDIKSLLANEDKSKLQALLLKYFGKEMTSFKAKRKRSYVRYYAPPEFLDREYSKPQILVVLINRIRSMLEKRNILSIEDIDLRCTDICGVLVPREVILIIIRYYEEDFGIAAKNLGRINSFFYLTILSNFDSVVTVRSSKQLSKISVLVLQSTKHLALEKLLKIDRKDYEYLVDNVTPSRIRSLRFNDVKLRNIYDFFKVCHEKSVVFQNCDVLQFPRNMDVLVTEEKIEIEKNTLCCTVPNVRHLYYPVIIDFQKYHDRLGFGYVLENFDDLKKSLSSIQIELKKLTRVKKLGVLVGGERDYIMQRARLFSVVEELFDISKFEKLEFLEDWNEWGGGGFPHSDSSQQIFLDSRKHFPYLQFLKTRHDITVSEDSYSLEYLPVHLIELEIAFVLETLEDYPWETININGSFRISHFPKTLTVLRVVSPPVELLENIGHLERLEKLEVSLLVERIQKFSIKGSTISDFFRDSVQKLECLEILDILLSEYHSDYRGDDIGIVQCVWKKRLGKTWLYHLFDEATVVKKFLSVRDKILESIRNTFKLVSLEEYEDEAIESTPSIAISEKSKNRKKQAITSLYVFQYSNKKKDWTSVKSKVLGDETKYKEERQGARKIVVSGEVYFKPSIWVKNYRRRFFVE